MRLVTRKGPGTRDTVLPCEQIDTHLWKHYLPATTVGGVNYPLHHWSPDHTQTPLPGHVQICSLWSPECSQAGGWQSTDMPSCLLETFSSLSSHKLKRKKKLCTKLFRPIPTDSNWDKTPLKWMAASPDFLLMLLHHAICDVFFDPEIGQTIAINKSP